MLALAVLVLGDDALSLGGLDRADRRHLARVRDAKALAGRVDELRPEGGGDELGG